MKNKIAYIPSQEEFLQGIEEFKRREPKDAIYEVSSFFISHFWKDLYNMTIGTGAFLLSYNQAFYRYGIFDFDRLESCIRANLFKLSIFRKRHIADLLESDEKNIAELFKEFLEALQIDSGRMKGRKSPVSVSKALHILAPDFFPMWDYKIARAYGYDYYKSPDEKYILFCRTIRIFANRVKGYATHSDKTLVKLIDEYNFEKYTRGGKINYENKI
ncbi:hypothetical protein ES695_17690 [Candidatus Atribacteria bacterium 1244-E10-H5-B2]|nr:MAG: hypothetical protein ES695_17690 [Candidatus Atribacteria bacterium 1244-E10-H5-B2]